MRKWYVVIAAFFLITVVAAASTLTSQYMINDRPISGLGVEELYDLHAATVDALKTAYESDCEANGAGKYLWIVNTNSRKYHYPYCPSALEAYENGTLTRGSAAQMAKDYSPCGRCNPPTK